MNPRTPARQGPKPAPLTRLGMFLRRYSALSLIDGEDGGRNLVGKLFSLSDARIPTLRNCYFMKSTFFSFLKCSSPVITSAFFSSAVA